MATSWTAISTTSNIDGFKFEVPSLVQQTAAVPSSANGSIEITWSASSESTIFYVVLHFAEIQVVQNNSVREFNVYYSNGEPVFDDPISVDYLVTSYAWYIETGYTDYNMTLKRTARATLPPIINAFELYEVVPVTLLPTDHGDDIRINPPTDHLSSRTSPNLVDKPRVPEAGKNEFNLDKKRFGFSELMTVTNNLRDQIGIGGFGEVFKGRLQDGVEVAVKVRSESSSQGIQQFLNEVETLSRVHHKNLVSLIGYCKDADHIALVYEYMQKGNLQDWIRGSAHTLPWKQRLRIAYESAQGLEYLHKMCNPPLIHRDIKTSNILLSTNLEAKVSDFGLVRDCSGIYVSTKVVGTPGYLDPYYASTSQLTEKSDVFSFGVILLELITGKSPIVQGPQGGQHLTQFVQQRLSKGKIESVVDPNMGIQYNINSIWKVADMALRCTNHPLKRPDMTAIVTELKEALKLEMSGMESSSVASEDISQYSGYSRNDFPAGGEVHSGNFEMARMGGLPLPDYGPIAR
ncbi:hypothetical protein LUZ63_013646 [Rhynchospora breviuscula]|uniref:Protein kinase domain-containing protein n=1 Tax=Rhynchospora breviuscula TaxID=2022672 RepID=A0A9Q0C8Y3_9POAL|nr:hypothetical protein LUZ63_013646 [Rhynchospora breviuscula]